MSAIRSGAEVVHGVESEIREFVRRDAPSLRRAPDTDSELIVTNVGTLLQRASNSSLSEIDRLMNELQRLRERLESEGARVQREITEYAHLTQSSIQSTKIITEGLAQLTSAADGRIHS